MAAGSALNQQFRILLDEGFPSPPGFDPSSVDRRMKLTSLRDFDRNLVGRRIPDWFLYLRAEEAQFDALVTRDWHQSVQAEEMWTLTRTDLSIITWREPINDAIAEWGQLVAYMTEILKLINTHGHCVVMLPAPRLDRRNVVRASDALGQLAADEGRSNQQVRDEARSAVTDWLERENLRGRFSSILGI